MSGVTQALGGVCVALMCLASGAQAVTLSLAPSDAVRCMTPPEDERNTLEYPKDAFERKEGGKVSVELTFTQADREPSVKVAGDHVLNSLIDAVKQHVSRFRVPCLQDRQTAQLKQDYLFTPTDGRKVSWTQMRDADQARKKELLKCVQHQTNVLPSYPKILLDRGEQGVVALRLNYKDAVSAPDVESMDNTPHRWLVDQAMLHAAGYRMPCHQGAPVQVLHTYAFAIEGGDRVVIRDMQLVNYLRSAKDIEKAVAYFDFNTMKCPFELRVVLRQPADDNEIGEIGEVVAERRFFMDWLARQRIKFERKTQNRLIGQSFNLEVPCGTLNLGSQAGGGGSQ